MGCSGSKASGAAASSAPQSFASETGSPYHEARFSRDLPLGVNMLPGSLIVESIVPGSQADACGVHARAVIVAVDDVATQS